MQVDLVFMNKSLIGLNSLFSLLEKIAKKVGLQVNEEKPEYMFIVRRDSAGI